jgi:CBS domain-containing protein
MKVSDFMRKDVVIAVPTDPIQAVAQLMASHNVGCVIVCEDHNIRGVVTDRDIAIRAVAEGLPPDRPVGEIMTRKVVAVQEDSDINFVLGLMAEHRVRRLPVLGAAGEVVGVVSLTDLSLLVGQWSHQFVKTVGSHLSR